MIWRTHRSPWYAWQAKQDVTWEAAVNMLVVFQTRTVLIYFAFMSSDGLCMMPVAFPELPLHFLCWPCNISISRRGIVTTQKGLLVHEWESTQDTMTNHPKIKNWNKYIFYLLVLRFYFSSSAANQWSLSWGDGLDGGRDDRVVQEIHWWQHLVNNINTSLKRDKRDKSIKSTHQNKSLKSTHQKTVTTYQTYK